VSSSRIVKWASLGCWVCVAFLLGGCASPGGLAQDKTLVIRWQRLVDDSGDTCGRCGSTEQSIDEARRLLAASLKPLGMRVRVVKSQLTAAQFKFDPSESNRIWIGEETLDTILGAKTGTSACAGVCGGNPCRTTVVDGQSYETIPAELIVRAGLRVAADLLKPVAPPAARNPASAAPAKASDADLQPMPWLSPCE
jgi:hypothetical protein